MAKNVRSDSSTDSTNSKPSGKKKKDSKKEDKPKWMSKEPKDGKLKKTVEGKEYHWCEHHRAWGRHQTKDCKAKKKADSGSDNASSSSSEAESPALQLSRTLAAIAEDEE